MTGADQLDLWARPTAGPPATTIRLDGPTPQGIPATVDPSDPWADAYATAAPYCFTFARPCSHTHGYAAAIGGRWHTFQHTGDRVTFELEPEHALLTDAPTERRTLTYSAWRAIGRPLVDELPVPEPSPVLP